MPAQDTASTIAEAAPESPVELFSEPKTFAVPVLGASA
jgi:hypothetical protein